MAGFHSSTRNCGRVGRKVALVKKYRTRILSVGSDRHAVSVLASCPADLGYMQPHSVRFHNSFVGGKLLSWRSHCPAHSIFLYLRSLTRSPIHSPLLERNVTSDFLSLLKTANVKPPRLSRTRLRLTKPLSRALTSANLFRRIRQSYLLHHCSERRNRLGQIPIESFIEGRGRNVRHFSYLPVLDWGVTVEFLGILLRSPHPILSSVS